MTTLEYPGDFPLYGSNRGSNRKAPHDVNHILPQNALPPKLPLAGSSHSRYWEFNEPLRNLFTLPS